MLDVLHKPAGWILPASVYISFVYISSCRFSWHGWISLAYKHMRAVYLLGFGRFVVSVRDSSVGRAEDCSVLFTWTSLGRRFDSVSRELTVLPPKKRLHDFILICVCVDEGGGEPYFHENHCLAVLPAIVNYFLSREHSCGMTQYKSHD